jgi:acetate kinase
VSRILTINSGSSSIKFAVFQIGPSLQRLLSGTIERIGLDGATFHAEDAAGRPLAQERSDLPTHDDALRKLLDWLQERVQRAELSVVGHRVVLGGARYTGPRVITPDVIAELRQLAPLAPEHMPQEIAAIEAVTVAYPGVPQVACFDTAFHRRMPPVAQRYPLPRAIQEAGVLRFGFHGLSYEYLIHELRRVAGAEVADGRVILAHLGNGASMAALRHGASVDTTMGFTPTGGLMMATRTGDLDPDVILYLIMQRGMTPAQAHHLVSHQAGLLGVSGSSPDMRDLLRSAATDAPAAEAVELFCYQAKKFLGALAAVLDGLDTLVFTAGIGEHAAPVRWRICEGMSYLGIQLDPTHNVANDAVISHPASRVTVRVMQTNEELMIARHAAHLIGALRADADTVVQ